MKCSEVAFARRNAGIFVWAERLRIPRSVNAPGRSEFARTK
jgi:hypothetical protein